MDSSFAVAATAGSVVATEASSLDAVASRKQSARDSSLADRS
jgi:hypothetical protein